jgi:hypothetical protein
MPRRTKREVEESVHHKAAAERIAKAAVDAKAAGSKPVPTPPATEQPASRGLVTVCVPVLAGVGVIRITSTGQKPITKTYLLRCLASQTFALRSFNEDGGNRYIVCLKPGTQTCECKDWKERGVNGLCKHMNALLGLVQAGKL